MDYQLEQRHFPQTAKTARERRKRKGETLPCKRVGPEDRSLAARDVNGKKRRGGKKLADLSNVEGHLEAAGPR